MNLNGDIIIDSINLTDYVSDFNIDRPEIQNGLHKALVVIYNPGGRWNTTCNIGKSVEMKLGWGSSPATFFKGTVYDRKIIDGDKLQLFVGQKGWNTMLFQTKDEILLDKEVSDIVKNLLSGTDIGTTNVEFGSGAEVIREDFHSDGFPTDDTVEETSNVTYVVEGDYIPADQDAWTEDPEEENKTDYATENDTWTKHWTGIMVNSQVQVQVGSWAIKYTTDSNTLNALWKYILPSEDYFYWRDFKQFKIWIYREDVEIDDIYIRFSKANSIDKSSSEVKHINLDISDQTVDTWAEYIIEKPDCNGVYQDILDSEQVKYFWIGMRRPLPIGKSIYIDGIDVITERWGEDSEFILSKDTGVKEQGTASVKGTHRKVYFEDDFNTDTDNQPPSKWTLSSVGADYKILVCSYWTSRYNYGDLGIWDGDRSCNIIDMNTSNQVYMYKELGTGVTGSGIINFMIRPDRQSGEEGWTTFTVFNNTPAEEIAFRIKHDYTNDETDMEYKDSSGWHALTSMMPGAVVYVEITYDETAATYSLTVTQRTTETETVSGKAFITNGTGLKKVQFETEVAVKSRSMVDGFFWGTESGGSDTERELWYHVTKDEAFDCEIYSIINFHIRQNVTDEDPVLRLYSSTGNFFYRILNITSADIFQEFNIEVGSAASGWSQTGTPDWENINWIVFYWAAAHVDVTATYIDKLYFIDPSGGYWQVTKDTDDPVDKELGTENESGEWGSSDTLTVGDSVDPKHTGTHATSLGDAAADSITDDDAVDFDGDFTQMVDTNDKLEMLSGQLITQITDNSEECLGEGGNPLYHATKFKAKGTSVTTVGLRLRNDDNGTRVYYWQLRSSWGGANLDSGSFSVGGYFNSWKDVAVNYSGLTVGTWYFLRLAGADDRCFWKRQSTDVNADLIFVNSEGGDEAKDFTCTFDFTNEVGSYVSSEKDAGATNQWVTMDITSVLDGATIKLYTDSNDDQVWTSPSWTLRATLVGGAEVDIDISGEDGRYFKYKVDVESGAGPTTEADDIDMYYGTTGAGQIRYGYYPTAKNWAKDLSAKFKWNFWFYSDTTEDLEVRMYTSAGNYFYRTLPVVAADTWERHNILIGTGSTGWSTTGSPNWNDIDWLEFYISAAKTRTISYVDEQYFDAYLTSGYIISHKLLTDGFEYFDDVKFDCETDIPSGVTITRKASNDDGVTYDTCVEDTWTELSDHHSTAENHGRIFKYKIEFTGGTNTPKLYSVAIDVKTIPIVVLAKFERMRESRLQTVQRLANINNSDGYINTTPDLHFFPATTKASGKTMSRQKGIWNFNEQRDEHAFRNKVYLHGALDATFPLQSDDYCEGDAGSWNSSGITLSDDTDIFKIGIQSIRGLIGLSGGWHDDCQDDVISTTYWDQHKTGSNTIVEANGYIRCHASDYPSNICFINYKEGTHDLSGDFDISFSVRTNNSSLEATICALVTNPPQYGTINWVGENLDYIKFDSPNTIKLCRPGLARITLKTNINTNQMYQIRIKRASTTHTIYIDGEQVWSGTTIVDNDHDNIQFGDFRTNEGQKNIDIDYDNFSYGVVGAAESTATSPCFTKNLDLYNSLHLWYRQDALGSVTIRVRTDASNYYSWTVTPTLINEFYELIIPVGSLSAGWSSTGSPSWQNITDVMFVYPNGTSIAIFNIDELCLLAKEVIVYSELVSGSYGTAIYGIKELRIYDRSIKDKNYAGAIVRAIRNKLDDPLEIIKLYTLLDVDVDPGDSITLIIPDRGISGLYYIKDIVYTKGYKMQCVFSNSEINLEHLLLGFDTHDRGIAQGVVESDALEICVD